MSTPLNVGVLIYAGADIMDFSGPVEVYSTRPPPDSPKLFNVTTFAHTSPVSGEGNVMVYIPGAKFSDVEQQLEDFDVLVVPGAHPDTIEAFIASEEGKRTLALLQKFVQLAPRKETGHRILQSVCTGALILGAAGVLAGRTATTHHMSYDMLKDLADRASGGDSGINVLKKRWVDGGKTEEGVRIVNAGGVSSGIDASLWITELVGGEKQRKFVEEIVEFERRGEGQAWGISST